MCLGGNEHQAAHHFLLGAEDGRADPHEASVDLAVRHAHARRAQPLQVGAEFIPVFAQAGLADFGRVPQHQVAQLVGRQVRQDGLGRGASEHGEGPATRVAGFNRVVGPVAVHAHDLVAVIAAQHQVGVQLVARGPHDVARGAHQGIVLAQMAVQLDDA
ncbi:hypothetical protein D9M70_568440 [compost metagenome]